MTLFFVDANVLIYTRDFRDPAKARRASAWLTSLAAREAAIVNLQVLNEVTHVALRKLAHLGPVAVRRWVDELAELGDTAIDTDVVRGAWDVRDRYGLSWFDCILLSAADRLGCTHVLTEDMGAPRQIGSLSLINPFKADIEATLAAT